MAQEHAQPPRQRAVAEVSRRPGRHATTDVDGVRVADHHVGPRGHRIEPVAETQPRRPRVEHRVGIADLDPRETRAMAAAAGSMSTLWTLPAIRFIPAGRLAASPRATAPSRRAAASRHAPPPMDGRSSPGARSAHPARRATAPTLRLHCGRPTAATLGRIRRDEGPGRAPERGGPRKKISQATAGESLPSKGATARRVPGRRLSGPQLLRGRLPQRDGPAAAPFELPRPLPACFGSEIPCHLDGSSSASS